MLTVQPGEPVRFFVVDAADGRCSMSWTIEAAKNNASAWCRWMGDFWKITMHAKSGEWHAAFHGRGRERFVPPGTSSHFDAWSPPEECHPGLRRSVEIVFPDSELRAGVPDRALRPGDRIVAVPAPGDGYVAVVEIVFGPAGMREAPLVIDSAFDVATLLRADGSVLRVVALQRPWEESSRGSIVRQKAEQLSRLSDDQWAAMSGRSGASSTACMTIGRGTSSTWPWTGLRSRANMDERIPTTHRTTNRLEVWPREMRAPASTPDPGTFPSTHIEPGVACSEMAYGVEWVAFYAAPDGHVQQFHARRIDWDEGTEAMSPPQ